MCSSEYKNKNSGAVVYADGVNSKGERILSGMRPTGKLHVGHLFGVLENWKKLCADKRNECFFMVADIHALTTEYADTKNISSLSLEIVKDWLASGIEPSNAVIFRQSDVSEHAELHLYLSMITPLGWLTRCPTYKEQMKELKDKDLHTYGFLGYPLLQASDILIYKATAVPVGEDQLPHIEFTREVARRFNTLYGKSSGDIFPEPKSLITNSPRIPGTDGRKMSKSYNNAIYLDDEPAILRKKINSMFTDPVKIRKDDKGHPDGCVVFAFHKILNPSDSQIRYEECRMGKIGCVSCKNQLFELFDSVLSPIRQKRKSISDKDVTEILIDGAVRAKKLAGSVIRDVKKAIGLGDNN